MIPELTTVTPLDSLASLLNKQAVKLNLNPSAGTSLNNINFTQQPVEIFVGPEGGINDEESELLKALDFTEISFGPRILRTETAGPAVISALQMLWGDF